MSPDGSHLAVADAGAVAVYVIDLNQPSSIKSFPYASQFTFSPSSESPTAVAITNSGVVYIGTTDLGGYGLCVEIPHSANADSMEM